jgi:uncharacterized membrane protein
MRVGPVIVAVLTVLYPFAIWLGLGRVEPRWLAVLLLVLALARAVTRREAFWWAAAGAAGLLVLAAALANDALPLKLYPVLVNLVLLLLFATSLWRPPSVIERLARLREPNLPPSGVAWTRRVTIAWCVFFLGNGGTSALTALFASDRVWALYNGLIAYLLMGLLFAGEWLLRPRHRVVGEGGCDPRVCPARRRDAGA